MSDNFQVGKPVTGSEFIGRERELKTISQLVNSGQSVVLIAPRRFGKTSLLLKLLQDLRNEKCSTSYVDIFTTPDLKRFSELLTIKVLENKN
ncbi:MAG: hypothetical protein HC906_17890 [Bacteroidales bacterium]|nr:hypothetical protein [Bacteroidales bacterium]